MSSVLRGSLNYLWDVSKALGQGATSMVYKGRNKSTGEEVAVKVFSEAGNMRPRDVQMREYTVMRKLRHRNIVSLLAIEEEQGTHNKVIVMELTDHGSLFNMLEDPKNAYGLPEEEFLIVFEHVSSGMKYIRDSGIVHRDIKPGNILRYIGEDGRSIYRLTDFGAAKEIEDEEEQFMSLYGTEEYLHPDIYARAVLRDPDRRQFTAKVDLWSLGVTFFHVATGQLPFKPYGGRKNRVKMFEITRHKESGVIQGIQHTEGGAIDWSRDLPPTCRLSRGLKLLITPIFAHLLESKPERVWNFDAFFKEVDIIIKKKIVNVFCAQSTTSLKVYINKENTMANLQELIADQTDISASSQVLIFDGQLLRDHVQAMIPITSYPDGITVTNPIFCFNANIEEPERYPNPVIRDFPKFTSSLTAEDYPISKLCAAIGCYILKEVQLLNDRQKLVRRSVHVFIHELYHICDHLVDYHTFLERNCDTAMRWKDNFLRTFRRELGLMKMLIEQADCMDQLNNLLLEMEEFHRNCNEQIERSFQQISELRDEVSAHLAVIREDQLQKKVLKKQWNGSIGCTEEDRCVQKVAVISDHILKIKAQFHDDRKKSSLNFNEEQIHKYEKNILSELCIKIKSLFFDHCFNGAKSQFMHFHSWYRSGCEVKHQSAIIEHKLLELANQLEEFDLALNRLCLKYNDEIERYVLNIKEKLREKEFTPIRPGSASVPQQSVDTLSQRSGDKKHRQRLIQAVLEGLMENKRSVEEARIELETNAHLLNQFSSALQLEPNSTTPSSFLK